MAQDPRKMISRFIRKAAHQGAVAGRVPTAAIEDFLRTGERPWSNAFGLEAIKEAEAFTQAAKTAMRSFFDLASQMLPTAVRSVPRVTPETIRERVEPMVKGLVQKDWQETAARELAARTFVLNLQGAKAAFDAELSTGFVDGGWQVLWAFLDDHGLKPSDIEVSCEGLSVGSYAHVRWSALNSEDPYSDVVVHEAAHLLHYLKPAQFNLRIRRGQERFVDVGFRHRELFAYTCEAYSRVILQHDRRAGIAFAEKMREDAFSFPAEQLDAVATLLLSAARARNGWRVIRELTGSHRSGRNTKESAPRSLLANPGGLLYG
jgi:hypothetical protein